MDSGHPYICPACGWHNPPARDECMACGEKMPKPKPEPRRKGKERQLDLFVDRREGE